MATTSLALRSGSFVPGIGNGHLKINVIITLDLPPDLEARFLAESKAQGLPVAEVIKAHLYLQPPIRTSGQPSAADVLKWLNKAADVIPADVPALSDHAMSRESIYSREDDWNR